MMQFPCLRKCRFSVSFGLAIPRPCVRQTAVFASRTKQSKYPNNQANRTTTQTKQSVNKSSPSYDPILLHSCCPVPQPAGEGSAAGLLLPVSGELLGVRSGMVGGKTTEESECGEERRPNGRGLSHLYLSRGTPHTPPTAATLGTTSLASVERTLKKDRRKTKRAPLPQPPLLPTPPPT